MDDGFRTRGSHILKVRVLQVNDNETHKHIDALWDFHIKRKGVTLPYLLKVEKAIFVPFRALALVILFKKSKGKNITGDIRQTTLRIEGIRSHRNYCFLQF